MAKATPRWVRRGVQFAPRYVPECAVRADICGNGMDGTVRVRLTSEPSNDEEKDEVSMNVIFTSDEIDKLVVARDRVKKA